tara:strand:- start:1507 stop:1719 length:213 start_codon:yes stop_codon:yes gene_type:complete
MQGCTLNIIKKWRCKMIMIYSNKDAKRIAAIKAAALKVKTDKAATLRIRIEDLLAERVTLDKGNYTWYNG